MNIFALIFAKSANMVVHMPKTTCTFTLSHIYLPKHTQWRSCWCCHSRHTSIFVFLFFSGAILMQAEGVPAACHFCLSFSCSALTIASVRTICPLFGLLLACLWPSSFILLAAMADVLFKAHTHTLALFTGSNRTSSPLYFFLQIEDCIARKMPFSALFHLCILLSLLWCSEKKRNCNRQVISSAVFKRNTLTAVSALLFGVHSTSDALSLLSPLLLLILRRYRDSA